MNIHSILLKLNILFAIALIATLIAGFSLAMHSLQKKYMELSFQSRLMMKEMRMTGVIPQSLLNEFDFVLMTGDQKLKVLKNAKERVRPPLPKNLPRAFPHSRRDAKVLTYKGHLYLWFHAKEQNNILIRNNQSIWTCCWMQIMNFLGILLLLIMMYILLRRSLFPLKKLHNDIQKYAEGKLDTIEYIDKHDEVSLTANAFYTLVEKLQQLKDSRNLFIRNIFHELNTPVTKGKILAEIVEDDKNKEILHSIFTRQSLLLKELAHIESITSENYILNLKSIRIREILDEASDLLYLEEPITTNINNEMMVADFSSMAIVFKNLIDNANKYGKNLEIVLKENELIFMSEGEALQEKLLYYTEAFSKGKNIATEKGFGLGLYIVNEIIKRHNMQLLYSHNNGKNHFSILL